MLAAIIASSAGSGDRFFLRWSDRPGLPIREEPVEVIECGPSELVIRSASRLGENTEVFLVGDKYTTNGLVRSCRPEGDRFLLAIHTGSEFMTPELLPSYDPGLFAIDDFLTEEEESKILESLKRGDSDRGTGSKRLNLLGLFIEATRKVLRWRDFRFQQRAKVVLAYTRLPEVRKEPFLPLTPKIIGLWGAMAAFAFAAVAQTASEAGTNRPNPVAVTGQLGAFIAPASPVGGKPWQPVTGLPYSAEQTSERVQTLADGTHIQQMSYKAMLYRDSEGRTRTERSFAPPPDAVMASGPSLIEITDPVAGYRYVLDSRNHTARRSPWPPALQHVNNAASAPAASSRAVLSFDAPHPNAPASSALPPRPHPEMTRESLGTQWIEGVSAEGTRRTTIYPEGLVGNDRPIITVAETWTSPELKTIVLSKVSDPRNGDSTTKLTNLSRAEPDPALFQIPADYTVTDEQPPTVMR